MLPHVNVTKQFPSAYEAQVALDKRAAEAAEAAGLPHILVELVKIRVSQLNGCAHCLRMHTRDAVAAGESVDRLAVLPAWWESQYFTDQEQAALVLAERITRIANEHTSPTPDTHIPAALSEQQIAAVTWLAVVINGWNRIAITSGYPVGYPVG
ncbi:MAG: carboxymuconolactone decarboxylase family protein [Rhodococcus sp. (in: high G+C Gram-positive bacteria)]|jgi:AhpD family alkylhydroperoxidase|uniref:carboxymuconolactone decarboxylase family protein n=1 Tax=Rhodococcus sp. I2R TaxID=2855445 RepID=UPI000959560F|nr:carboxymuconolactone decarboxylase family protein [Rhodococcus sp. I2R]MCC8929798.1 carboxymuconolactone decarboxylase family protein [Rhodococcus sp. I2R]OLT32515.1 alkylhydroperoxidase [Rhodococcus sp. CUA-806]OLT36463.1 alkylhydroperoxidase [Rhodococcus sp. CUA-806]